MQRSLIAAVLAMVCVPAFAQDVYPSRPITMIVPFPPGGVADITGRPTAIALETSKGDLPLALGLGMVLVAIIIGVNLLAHGVKVAAQHRYG